jgi:hypothetical protein
LFHLFGPFLLALFDPIATHQVSRILHQSIPRTIAWCLAEADVTTALFFSFIIPRIRIALPSKLLPFERRLPNPLAPGVDFRAIRVTSLELGAMDVVVARTRTTLSALLNPVA